MEPTWSGEIHGPGNAAFALTCLIAWPDARVSYAADRDHFDAVSRLLTIDQRERLGFIEISARQDVATTVAGVWSRLANWGGSTRRALRNADLIILLSAAPSVLTAFWLLGLSKKTWALLHGDAQALSGWRSRNPFSRAFDLTSGIRRFVQSGGRLLHYEKHAIHALRMSHPFLGKALHHIPYALLVTEAEQAGVRDGMQPGLDRAMRVGFAGVATRAKGFEEFSLLARNVGESSPRPRIEFHAVGKLHPDSRGVDVRALASKPSTQPLARHEYLKRLGGVDFVFVWQGDYYQTAASGVIYDALNLGIPVLARRTDWLEAFLAEGRLVGRLFDDLNEVEAFLRSGEAEKYISGKELRSDVLGTARSAFLPESVALTVKALVCSDAKHPN